jgi:serine/threonine protein kinase/WD40 repeat protein
MHDSTQHGVPAIERYAEEGRADLLANLLELSEAPAEVGLGNQEIDPAAISQSAHAAAGHLPAHPRISIGGYELVLEISRGGQAVVYEGIQQSTGRRVAIKILREGPLATPQELARFDREVQILTALNHPNIVSVIDRGVTSTGSMFLVMPYIAGRHLDQYLQMRQEIVASDAAHEPADRVVADPADALRLFLKICDAVNAAHLRGIVHRDLKPSNIRIDDDGDAHVLDFGLARPAFSAHAAGGGRVELTLTGQFIGSLPWASPEQADGVAERIDTRSDVYSLGVILYQMLTGGRFPYEVVGTMRDVLNNILTKQPTPPSAAIAGRAAGDARRAARRRKMGNRRSNINPVVESIVLKALSKRREERYQTAGELARDIENYLAGRPTQAAGAGGPQGLWGWPALSMAAVACAAMITVAIIVWPGSKVGMATQRGLTPAAEGRPGDSATTPVTRLSGGPWVAPVVPPIPTDVAVASVLEPIAEIRLEAAADRLRFSPDGQRLLICTSHTGFVRAHLWDMTKAISAPIDGSSDPVFTADGTALVSPWGGTTRRDPRTGEQEAVYPVGASSAVAAFPGGHLVACTVVGLAGNLHERALVILDAATGGELARWPMTEAVVQFSVAPDGRTMIYSNNRGCFAFGVDPEKGEGRQLWELITDDANSAVPVFSGDGSQVVLCGPIPTVCVYGTRDGKRIATFQHLSPPRSAGYLPDGKSVITADGNRRAGLHLWDVVSGRELPKFERLDLPGPCYVSLTADGTRAIVGCGNGAIVLIDIATGRELARIGRDPVSDRSATKADGSHSGTVKSICVSPDGRLAATAGADRTVKLWRLTPAAARRPTTAPATEPSTVPASGEHQESDD